MALTAAEIAKLKGLPDSPMKDLMLRSAGLETKPEKAFSGGNEFDTGFTSYLPDIPSLTSEPMSKVGAADYSPPPMTPDLAATKKPKPMGESGMSIAGQAKPPPAIPASETNPSSGKLAGAAKVTEPEVPIGTLYRGLAPFGQKANTLVNRPDDESPKKASIGAEVAEPGVKAITQEKAPAGYFPTTEAGIVDVDELVRRGQLTQETADKYKASKVPPMQTRPEPGAMVREVVPSPLALPQAHPGSWMDQLDSHMSAKPASVIYDYPQPNKGGDVTVGPITQVMPEMDVGLPGASEVEDPDNPATPPVADYKMTKKQMQSLLKRLVDRKAVEDLAGHNVPTVKTPADKPEPAKLPSADTMKAFFKNYDKKKVLDI